MTLRKRILIAVLAVAFVAFAMVLTVVIVHALLQTTATIPSTGHIGP